MQPIHQKALADITWADFEALVAGTVAEGPNLEYKRTLADPNGGDDPWIKGQDRIGRPARDELAREIVAFANAYGGLLLLGIDEEKGSGAAQALAPLPRCADLAERLQRAIGDVVDPPMPGFDVRAIPAPEGDGRGIIALRVSASSAAPHGYGEPPQTYVRRGASATPMTMRDLQAVFWDARTRRERVEAIRAEHQRALEALPRRLRDRTLLDTNGASLEPSALGLFVRVSAIPQFPISINPFPFEHWRLGLRPEIRRLADNAAPAFGDGYFDSGWTRTAHGAWCIEQGPGRWSFRDDGTCSIIGFNGGTSNPNRPTPVNFHAPVWYAMLVAQVMICADRMRRDGGRPDVPIEIDIQFLHDGSVIGGGEQAYRYGGDRVGRMLPEIAIGPALMLDQQGMNAVYEHFEREIWHSFGITAFPPEPVAFDRAFAAYKGPPFPTHSPQER